MLSCCNDFLVKLAIEVRPPENFRVNQAIAFGILYLEMETEFSKSFDWIDYYYIFTNEHGIELQSHFQIEQIWLYEEAIVLLNVF